MKRLILPNPVPIWQDEQIVDYKKYEEAEKIVKDGNNIIGYDSNDREVFALKGISNMNLFSLADGATWDFTEIDTLKSNILDLENALFMALVRIDGLEGV